MNKVDVAVLAFIVGAAIVSGQYFAAFLTAFFLLVYSKLPEKSAKK